MPPNVAVVTSFPPHWRELADITTRTQRAWCDRNGYDYVVDCSDIRDPRTRSSIAGFVKLDLLSHLLERYDFAVWLDADMVITNPENHPKILPTNLTLPYDMNGHNATVISCCSTPRMKQFLWACNNAGRTMFLAHDWKEMEAMRYFMQTPPYASAFDFADYRSAKELCPILAEEYLLQVPLHISAPYAWEPGDWSLHLSALHIDRRVELARKYAP